MHLNNLVPAPSVQSLQPKKSSAWRVIYHWFAFIYTSQGSNTWLDDQFHVLAGFLWFSASETKRERWVYTGDMYICEVCVSVHVWSLSVFRDTADCRLVSPHSWCLILSPLSFHLCYCFSLLTFQTNPVRQTDHRCPAETSPLSEDNLSANLLIFLMNSHGFLLFFLFFFFVFNVTQPELTMLYHVRQLCMK